MKCDVKYFGMVGERVNKTSEEIILEDFISDKNDLKKSFLNHYPELKNISFQVAIDGELMNELPDSTVKLIALLPPFAGG